MSAFLSIATGVAFLVALARLVAWATRYDDDLD